MELVSKIELLMCRANNRTIKSIKEGFRASTPLPGIYYYGDQSTKLLLVRNVEHVL